MAYRIFYLNIVVVVSEFYTFYFTCMKRKGKCNNQELHILPHASRVAAESLFKKEHRTCTANICL